MYTSILNEQVSFSHTTYSDRNVKNLSVLHCMCRLVSAHSVQIEVTDSKRQRHTNYTTTNDLSTTSIRICHR